MPTSARIRLVRRTLLIATAAALVAASVISFRSTYEADLFWHLAQGREVAAGRLVRPDLFSYVSPDYPQPYTGWLFDLGIYGLWRAGGAPAVQAAQAGLIALALVLCTGAALVESSAAASIVVSALVWLAMEPRAIPRPHVFSFAALALCVWLIERSRSQKSARPLLWAIPLIGVWSNVHVESVFGVAAIAILAGCEWLRPSALRRAEAARATGIVALAASAALINPYGVGGFASTSTKTPRSRRSSTSRSSTRAYPAELSRLLRLRPAGRSRHRASLAEDGDVGTGDARHLQGFSASVTSGLRRWP